MDKIITSLGLMSGTSLDGIDASIIKSDGNSHLEILLNKFFPYSHDFKQKLGNYINNINSLKDIENSKSEYKELEREITLYHSQISNEIISEQNISLDIVGFHGQTIIHKPSEKYTIQMGDPNLLSQILKKNKVKKVLSFDETKPSRINSGVIINGIFFAKKKLKKIDKIKVYQGSKFIVLDEKFSINKINKNQKLFNKILVTSGGSDKKKMMFRVLLA